MAKNRFSLTKQLKNLHKSNISKWSVFLIVAIVTVLIVPQMLFAAISPEKMDAMVMTILAVYKSAEPDESSKNTDEPLAAEDSPSGIPAQVANTGEFVDAADAADPNRKIHPNIDNTGYASWDEISPEMQQVYKSGFSDEDISRMFAPRRWITLPDVVGLTEKDAVKAFHDKGVSVRVFYEDRDRNYGEGICFFQDLPAGMKFNTDANIEIKIQKSKSAPEPTAISENSPNPEPTTETVPSPTPTITPSPAASPIQEEQVQTNQPEPTSAPKENSTEAAPTIQSAD